MSDEQKPLPKLDEGAVMEKPNPKSIWVNVWDTTGAAPTHALIRYEPGMDEYVEYVPAKPHLTVPDEGEFWLIVCNQTNRIKEVRRKGDGGMRSNDRKLLVKASVVSSINFDPQSLNLTAESESGLPAEPEKKLAELLKQRDFDIHLLRARIAELESALDQVMKEGGATDHRYALNRCWYLAFNALNKVEKKP